MNKFTLTLLILTSAIFSMFLLKFHNVSAEGYFPDSIEKVELLQQATPSPTTDGSSPREDLCPIIDLDCEEPAGSTDKLPVPKEENLSNADVILILFWMQDCPHCEEVLTNVLPDIESTYQDQVAIFPIELNEIETIDIFYAMAERLGVSKNNIGVPLIIIGDQVLTGDEINHNLTNLIDKYLQTEDYRILSIPEFEDQLPDSIQAKETIIEINRTRFKNHSLLVGSIIGVSIIILLILAIKFIKKNR